MQLYSQKILFKSYKILALSFGLLILSFTLFFWRELWPDFLRPAENFKGGRTSIQSLSDGTLGGVTDFKSFPAPSDFKSFDYDPKLAQGQEFIRINADCQEAYYAILIYSASDDYRQSPNSAKYNKAFGCKKGQKIEHSVDLIGTNLIAGKYYYFVADQNESGQWYNPR